MNYQLVTTGRLTVFAHVVGDKFLSMLSKFQVHPNGNYGFCIFIRMVIIVAMASITTLAKGEGFALQSTSEKTGGLTQNKTEVPAPPRQPTAFPYQPTIDKIEQCKEILHRVSDQSEQVKRVRKILKKNLHFHPFGFGHMILSPGWYAGYSDMVAAHSSMSEDDIPILVSLIGRGKLKDGMRSIGFGALGEFGGKAFPCIEAGKAMYPEQASDLFAVKSNIEVNIQYPPNPDRRVPNPPPDQQYPETHQGGKQP